MFGDEVVSGIIDGKVKMNNEESQNIILIIAFQETKGNIGSQCWW